MPIAFHDLVLVYLAGALVQAAAAQPIQEACEWELVECADELAEAELTLNKARLATELAEVVLERGGR